MPALSNPRHERFAQLIAAGGLNATAYLAAGFKASGLNADRSGARLAKKAEVSARIKELVATHGEKIAASLATDAQDVRYDRARVLRRLAELSAAAEAAGQHSAAVRAEELIGRANGQFVERHEDVEIDFENLTPAQRKKVEQWLEEQAFKDDPRGLEEWRKTAPGSTALAGKSEEPLQ